TRRTDLGSRWGAETKTSEVFYERATEILRLLVPRWAQDDSAVAPGWMLRLPKSAERQGRFASRGVPLACRRLVLPAPVQPEILVGRPAYRALDPTRTVLGDLPDRVRPVGVVAGIDHVFEPDLVTQSAADPTSETEADR